MSSLSSWSHPCSRCCYSRPVLTRAHITMSESRPGRSLEKGRSHRIISLRFRPRLRNACRGMCGLGIALKAEAKSQSAGWLSHWHVKKESYLIRRSKHSSIKSWWYNCTHMVLGMRLGGREGGGSRRWCWERCGSLTLMHFLSYENAYGLVAQRKPTRASPKLFSCVDV